MALEFGEGQTRQRRSDGAPISIRLEPDPVQMAAAQKLLAGIPGGVNRAVRLAINRTLLNGRTVIVKGLSEITTAKPKDLRKRLKIIRATGTKLYGKVDMQKSLFALKRFKHREKRKKKGWGTEASGEGVFVQVMRSGSPVRFPHSFLADLTVRGKGIYRRTVIPGGPREFLTNEKAVDMAPIFWRSPELGSRLVQRMREQFAKNLADNVRFVAMGKPPPRGGRNDE